MRSLSKVLRLTGSLTNSTKPVTTPGLSEAGKVPLRSRGTKTEGNQFSSFATIKTGIGIKPLPTAVVSEVGRLPHRPLTTTTNRASSSSLTSLNAEIPLKPLRPQWHADSRDNSKSESLVRAQKSFFHSAQNFTAEISARMNKLKSMFKFQNKIDLSKNTGDTLVRESELFCKLILAASTQNGLSKSQRDLAIPYVRLYSGASVDGSADNNSTKAQLAVIEKGYPDGKKSTVEEIRAIGENLEKSFGHSENLILKRSALYIAVQLIALDHPFSENDQKWISEAAKALHISEKEQSALTALSVLDHKYTPFGPKPVLSKAVFDEVIKELDAIEQQMKLLYLTEDNVAERSFKI